MIHPLKSKSHVVNSLEPAKVISVHWRLSHVNSLHFVSLNFEIVSKECFSLAAHQFIQNGHTHASEKIEGKKACLLKLCFKRLERLWQRLNFSY